MTPPKSSPSLFSPSTSQGIEPPSQEGESRKRVTKACDRCRLKKIKCDGQLPCSRCSVENSVCQYGERKTISDRRVPPGYVEYLEEQQGLLVKALKKSWQYVEPSETTANEDFSVHTILEKLGVMAELSPSRRSRSGFTFEEDLEVLREKCEVEGGVTSASTTTSHVASAEPTPARHTPEQEISVGVTLQPSRQATWPPLKSLYQQDPIDTVVSRPQPSLSLSLPPPVLPSQVGGSAPSAYRHTEDSFRHTLWHPPESSNVQNEAARVSSPESYWNPLQLSPWEPQEYRPPLQPEERGQIHYSTVDPADLVLETATGQYSQHEEAWNEYFRRMRESEQR